MNRLSVADTKNGAAAMPSKAQSSQPSGFANGFLHAESASEDHCLEHLGRSESKTMSSDGAFRRHLFLAPKVPQENPSQALASNLSSDLAFAIREVLSTLHEQSQCLKEGLLGFSKNINGRQMLWHSSHRREALKMSSGRGS